MAVTRIIPLRVGGKRSLAAALKKTVEYVKNPEKTDGGQLVTGYRRNPELAAAEFKMDYELYQKRDLMMTKKVVVLMPPPVEPAQAPQNIRANMMNFEVVGQRLKSVVENPVVVMTESTWKNESVTVSPTD